MSSHYTSQEMAGELVDETGFNWEKVGMSTIAKTLAKILRRENIVNEIASIFKEAVADLKKNNNKDPKTDLGKRLLAAMEEANKKIKNKPDGKKEVVSDSEGSQGGRRRKSKKRARKTRRRTRRGGSSCSAM